MRYPRDPTLDPQLVWKGKDEQDATTSRSRRSRSTSRRRSTRWRSSRSCAPRARAGAPSSSSTSSRPYTDLTFEEKVDFYRHPGKWSNRMILGDSLLVMTSLAEKEGLKGQVQTIYIDPPYGIKFGSNWQVSHAQARRPRRQGHGPHAPARAGPRVPRHLGARHPLVPGVPARSAGGGARAADRVRLDLRPDRRRERPPRSESCSTRCSAPRTSSRRSRSEDQRRQLDSEPMPRSGRRLHPLVRTRPRARSSTDSCIRRKDGRGADAAVHVGRTRRTERDADDAGRARHRRSRRAHAVLPLGQPDVADGSAGSAASFPFEFDGRDLSCQATSGWKTNPDGMRRLVAAGRDSCASATRFATSATSTTSRVCRSTNVWDDTAVGLHRRQGLRRPDEHARSSSDAC